MTRDTRLSKIYDAALDACDGLMHFRKYAIDKIGVDKDDDLYFELQDVVNEVCRRYGYTADEFRSTISDVYNILLRVTLSDIFEF